MTIHSNRLHSPGKELATIVIADDDADDRELILRALSRCVRNPVHTVGDGEELLHFLRGQQEPEALPPECCLVLLDLNMPRKNGHEALREIREDPALRAIPVIVLTTTDADHEIGRSYDLGANAYMTKPVSFEGFVKAMQGLQQFWFEIVQLPHETRRF